MTDRPDKPADSYPSSPWALMLVLVAVAIGVGFAVTEYWRRAALMFAGAMMLGAGLRLVLPRRLAGLLVVRRRSIDVTVMALIGIAITVAAFVVPPAK